MGEAFNNIIKACFEGFFGTMIAGLLFYTIQSFRKNWKNLLWVWLMLAGIIVWRLFIRNFYSPRYAVICLYPAILLTVFLMVKFKKWWWILLTILGVVSCIKILRPSPTGRIIYDVAKIIRQDSSQDKAPMVVVDQKDIVKMEFYTSLPVCYFLESRDMTLKLRNLGRIAETHARYASVIYFCFDVPRNRVITGKELGLNGEWNLLYQVTKNVKRNIDFRVYSYRKKTETLPIQIPPEGKNLIENGDFEKYTYFTPRMLQYFAGKSLPYFACNPQIPVSWYFLHGRPGTKVEYDASDTTPIRGKRSLRIKAEYSYCSFYSNLFLLNNRSIFSFRIRGKAGSQAELALYCYGRAKQGKPSRISLLPVKILQDKQIMECTFILDPLEYKIQGTYCRLLFKVQNGEVFLDDVKIVNRIQ